MFMLDLTKSQSKADKRDISFSQCDCCYLQPYDFMFQFINLYMELAKLVILENSTALTQILLSFFCLPNK
jgi:hypothetical protein